MLDILLALSKSGKGVLGAAAIDVGTGTLFLMEDAAVADARDSVAAIVLRLNPTRVFVNARSGDAFVDCVKGLGDFEVDVRPSTEFAFKTARNRFVAIQPHPDFFRTHSNLKHQHVFFDGAQDTDKTLMSLLLEGIVSLDCQQMVGSVGALLHYFSRSSDSASGDGGFSQIRSIEAFRMDTYMGLNQDALSSLNIFCNEKHPNMFSSDSKEGLSLFGLLNLTRSSLGKALFTKWFLCPSIELQVIQSRQAAVKQFLMSRHEDRVDSLRSSVTFIANIPRLCQKLTKKLTIQEWEQLLKFSFHSLKIRSACDQFNVPTAIFQKIRDVFNATELQEVGAQINHMIDFDSGGTDCNIVVKHGVDEDLDEMRHLYDGLDDMLSTVAREIAETIPDDFSDSLNVIYFPQLGYLITVPLQSHMTSQESFIIPGLDFQFCTQKTVFYKSEQMYQMDESIGDLHSIIADKEIALIQGLQDSVSKYSPMLIDVSSVCAELDCLLALAEAAKKYDFVCPEMVDSDVLEIVEGRHPLYEQCMDSFIGNDVSFGTASDNGTSMMDGGGSNATNMSVDGEDSLRVMLLTGPNYSGKSVYLKQVGLIVFMAHLGSYVPAKRATIGVTDRIITRIQAVESDSKIQSAFMIDSQQMAYAFRNATRRSLILIDEYGKGTLHANGVGLFCASLVNFLDRGENCPKVLSTTHFHELFVHNLLPQNHPLLGHFKMNVFQGTLENEERLTFLYRVVPGNSGSSLGLYCAKLAGISESVLERAHGIAESLESGVPLVQLTAKSKFTENSIKNSRVHDVVELFKAFDCDHGDLDELWEAVRCCEIANEE